MNNIPNVNLGLVAVSRDCFPIELSHKRRMRLFQSSATKIMDAAQPGAPAA